MDDLLILLLLVVGVAILSGIVLPIIALVISVRSRRRLTERIERLEAVQPSPGPEAPEQTPSQDSLPAAMRLRLRLPDQISAAALK